MNSKMTTNSQLSKIERKKKTTQKQTKQWKIVNLSDAEFKTLVITILTEMAEHVSKIEEEVKAMKSEIKKSIQGANSDGKETRTQFNDLEQKEEINIQPEQNEWMRIH